MLAPGRLMRSPWAALVGLPAGALLGALFWMAFGGASSADDRLQQDQVRLSAIRLLVPQSPADDLTADAGSHPLFALTTGPGAIADVAVSLLGVARTPKGAAALLAIGGGQADWLDLGKSRGGVTLSEVSASGVVLETALGRKEVELGPPTPSSMAASNIPPGVRLPPPPANAPTPP